MFESDYKRLYEEDTPDKETLKSFLQTKTILFLGFSLDDPFVTRQIGYLHNLYSGYSKDHYILQTELKDFRKYNIESIPVDNWDGAFDTLLNDLISTKKESANNGIIPNSNENKDRDISIIEDVILLEEMFKEKREEFDKAEDHLKRKLNNDLNVIKDRITELKLQKINLDFEIPDHEQNELENIFNAIYNSEKLSDKTLLGINKIREQHSKSHEWYHRSVIVSALACSLINFNKKIDPNKIDLLIDFVNDSEEKVWQKAINYLFMILNHLGRSWQKHKNLLPKLRHLQTHYKIQEALKVIIAFSQYELQRASPLNKRIFENEYFKGLPFNYFLPFYENNPSINNIYDDDIDNLEDYIKRLYDSPLPDAFKYLMCNSPANNKNKSEGDDDSSENIEEYIRYVLNIHSIFNPYLNYASEIINFYENSPLAKNTINQKISIVTFNGLKNILLNTVEHYRALARQFVVQEQWSEAVTHYNKLLKIEENDIAALNNLVNCLDKTKKSKNIDDRLELRLRIENLEPYDHKNLKEIGIIYRKKDDFKTALKYINSALQLDPENPNYLNSRGVTNNRLKDYQGGIIDFDRAISIDNKNPDFYFNRGVSRDFLRNYQEAILDYDIAIKLNDKDPDFYINRGFTKEKLKNYDGAILDFNVAIELDDKSSDAYNAKANTLRQIGDFEKAIENINKSIKLDNQDGRNYGTKAAIYSNKGDIEKFYELLEKAFQLNAKAIWLYDDIKEKYRNEKRFQDLLKKYDQTLDKE